jgi:hypothetical protein
MLNRRIVLLHARRPNATSLVQTRRIAISHPARTKCKASLLSENNPRQRGLFFCQYQALYLSKLRNPELKQEFLHLPDGKPGIEKDN